MKFQLLKVIYQFWATSLASEFEYRINFVIELISVFGNLVGSLFVLSLLYYNSDDLGGWTWYESLVVLGIYTFLEGITICFLQPNLNKIVRQVQLGTLDFILLKPFNSQVWLSLRVFSPWGLPSLASGLLIILYSMIQSSYIPGLFIIANSILMMFSSIVILYSLWFIISSTTIWFVKVWNANEVLRSVLVAGRYPISIYPIPIRRLFTLIIPIAFLTTIPAEAILSKLNLESGILSVFFAGLLLIVSVNFWRYALRFYTSASS